MKTFSFLFIITFATLGTACKGKKDEAAGGGGAAAKSEEAPKKSGPTKLDKLGLQLDVPGEVTVGAGIGGDGAMLQASSVGAMSLDQAKSDAGMYTPKNLKAETLPDGWTLTYDNTGSAGANYFVQVRRDIGGKSYLCQTTTDTAERAQTVLAACKSLRK